MAAPRGFLVDPVPHPSAVIAGEDDWVGVEEFGRDKIDFLSRAASIEHSVIEVSTGPDNPQSPISFHSIRAAPSCRE